MVSQTNVTPAPYCKHCRFYYGAHRVVCSIHPYGPDSQICSDYVLETERNHDRICREDQSIREDRSLHQVYEWKRWQKILTLGLLVGTFGLLKWWAIIPIQPKAINSAQPPTKQLPKTGYLR